MSSAFREYLQDSWALFGSRRRANYDTIWDIFGIYLEVNMKRYHTEYALLALVLYYLFLLRCSHAPRQQVAAMPAGELHEVGKRAA
jgi:hypothetical protein